jgi:hypothetical protein
MAHKDLHMVLRFDSANPEVFKSLTDLMRQTCREVHASAMLIHGSINDGSPAPDISLYADDFFEGKDDIDIKLAEEAQAADAAVPKSEIAD